MAMAQVMSGMPDVWQRVLAEHVPDQGGRCQACREEGGNSASWPCLTRRIAEQAKRIHDEPHSESPRRRLAQSGSGAAHPGSAHQLGPAQLGPAQLGSAQLGPAQLGSAQLGSAEWPTDVTPDSPQHRPVLRSVQRHPDVTPADVPPARSTGRHAAP